MQALGWFGHYVADTSRSKRRRISGCDERRCWGFGRAADCRCSSCSRVACAQAAAAARVAGKDGIHKAAERGDVAAVQDYLIADASCVKQVDGDYFRCDLTPPSAACSAIFAMLISCSIRRTPLHWAAGEGHVAVVQLLLSSNATVDARNRLYRPYHRIADENTLLIF
jgi:hypothetical protein